MGNNLTNNTCITFKHCCFSQEMYMTVIAPNRKRTATALPYTVLCLKKKWCLLLMWRRYLFFIRPPDSLENLTATSPSTLAPVNTSLMSFDGTVASTYQQVHVNRRSASCGDLSEKDSGSQCEEERRTQQSQITAKGAPRQGSNLSPLSQVIKSVFVQGVGWASQVRSTSSANCCFF